MDVVDSALPLSDASVLDRAYDLLHLLVNYGTCFRQEDTGSDVDSPTDLLTRRTEMSVTRMLTAHPEVHQLLMSHCEVIHIVCSMSARHLSARRPATLSTLRRRA